MASDFRGYTIKYFDRHYRSDVVEYRNKLLAKMELLYKKSNQLTVARARMAQEDQFIEVELS